MIAPMLSFQFDLSKFDIRITQVSALELRDLKGRPVSDLEGVLRSTQDRVLSLAFKEFSRNSKYTDYVGFRINESAQMVTRNHLNFCRKETRNWFCVNGLADSMSRKSLEETHEVIDSRGKGRYVERMEVLDLMGCIPLGERLTGLQVMILYHEVRKASYGVWLRTIRDWCFSQHARGRDTCKSYLYLAFICKLMSDYEFSYACNMVTRLIPNYLFDDEKRGNQHENDTSISRESQPVITFSEQAWKEVRNEL